MRKEDNAVCKSAVVAADPTNTQVDPPSRINVAHDRYQADVALMRKVMKYDPYTAVRDQRIRALAARLGGQLEEDFRVVRTRMETSPWAAIVDPATTSAIHRLCKAENGDECETGDEMHGRHQLSQKCGSKYT